MLRSDECDGFVSHSHWVQFISRLYCDLEAVGEIFRPEFTVWALRQNSVLLEPINHALLKLRANGITFNHLFLSFLFSFFSFLVVLFLKKKVAFFFKSQRYSQDKLNIKKKGKVDELFKKYIDIPEKCDSDDIDDDGIAEAHQVDIDDLTTIWMLLVISWIIAIVWRCKF